MSEYIYDNDPDEQNQEKGFNTTGESDEGEKTVVIYESSDIYSGHKAVTQSEVHLQPGRTFVRAVTVCLALLCVLLLAGIIGTGLHCRIQLQTHNTSWAEKRKQTLVELNHFCKDGCTSFNNSFYYISSQQKLSWEDSRQDCKDRGADLVIVNGKEEQELIYSLKRIFWIGLTDREEKGTWKWVDGSVLNSTGFWKTDQPSGKFGEQKDCVDTYWYGRLNSWSDDYCSTSQHWMCEKHIDF